MGACVAFFSRGQGLEPFACCSNQQDVHLPVCLLVHSMRAVQCLLEVPRVSHVCSCVSGLFRALQASNELTESPEINSAQSLNS